VYEYAGGYKEISDGRGLRAGPYLAGARASVSFVVATLVMGVSLGVLASSLGWGILAPIAFSTMAVSASAQFAVALVLGSGGGVLAAVAAAVLLNARFGPMGVVVAPYLKGGPLRRALERQPVIDASWALTAAVVALALVPIAPPGVPVIAACAAALLGLRRRSS